MARQCQTIVYCLTGHNPAPGVVNLTTPKKIFIDSQLTSEIVINTTEKLRIFMISSPGIIGSVEAIQKLL
jgi:hypothetical protein